MNKHTFLVVYKLHKIKKFKIIHEENTKGITTVLVVLYVIKNHVDLHKL
jgi:hypothetical protein